jgi:hypothetical protein
LHFKFKNTKKNKKKRYEAPKEIGPSILTDRIYFNVHDQEGNTAKDQVLTINVEPVRF